MPRVSPNERASWLVVQSSLLDLAAVAEGYVEDFELMLIGLGFFGVKRVLPQVQLACFACFESDLSVRVANERST